MPKREMISEAVCPRDPGDQRRPVHRSLVDGQTIGGYPKIAQVIQADLDILANCARQGHSLESCCAAVQREREA